MIGIELDSLMRGRVLILAAAVIASAAVAWPLPAAGVNTAEPLLLQMLVGESDLGPGGESDRAAQLFAIHRLARQRGRSVVDTMRDAISEMRNGYSERRRWIPNLTPGCKRPEGWPRSPWDAGWVAACSSVVAQVRAYYAGTLRDPCRGNPNQWRSRKCKRCIRRVVRKGWRRIGCGADTLHVFFDSTKKQHRRRS